MENDGVLERKFDRSFFGAAGATRAAYIISVLRVPRVPLRSSTLDPVHCSSNLCQGGSSRRSSISARLPSTRPLHFYFTRTVHR